MSVRNINHIRTDTDPQEYNMVTCGKCGELLMHKAHADIKELVCPYCGFDSDICEFPDFLYEGWEKDIVLDKHKHDKTRYMKCMKKELV